MRPDDPELIDRLAAEYVLGTLRGRARQRFERWRTSSRLVDERCLMWEERLVPLAAGITMRTPPARVWTGIRARLGLAEPYRRSRVRNLALAASVLLLVALGAVLYWTTFVPGQPTQIATIATPAGVAAWKVEVLGRSARLVMRAGVLPAIPSGRAYELWALPAGRPPVSLGVLPGTGTSRHALSAAQQRALAEASQVAVSIEPSGGSPTGQPTGPVVFVAPLRAVT
jgi:anti-sigma-K factor RskA